jgi:hypothetical protein
MYEHILHTALDNHEMKSLKQYHSNESERIFLLFASPCLRFSSVGADLKEFILVGGVV